MAKPNKTETNIENEIKGGERKARSKTGTLVIVGLLIVAMFAIAMPVEAKTVVLPALVTGQETSFMIYEGDTVEISYSPGQQGNKMFYTWHESLYHVWHADDPGFGLTKVNFYWKDLSNPNDPWHHWRSASVNYVWWTTTQNLYSGSSSIGYKFVYQTYTDAQCVYLKAQ